MQKKISPVVCGDHGLERLDEVGLLLELLSEHARLILVAIAAIAAQLLDGSRLGEKIKMRGFMSPFQISSGAYHDEKYLYRICTYTE